MLNLTEEEFANFLEHLGKDDSLFPKTSDASKKYFLLHQKLSRTLVWNKCPESQADDLADETLDRVAGKIAAGEEVRKTGSYALTVLRFVWLEHVRKHREIAVGDDSMPETTVDPVLPEDEDLRARCLRTCLARMRSAETVGDGPSVDNATLILEYYDVESGEKLYENRKFLALRLGFPMTVPDYRREQAESAKTAKPSPDIDQSLEQLENEIDRRSPDREKSSVVRESIATVVRDIKSHLKIRHLIEKLFSETSALDAIIAAVESAVSRIQRKSMTRLKVRAFRLREDLEKCINDCVVKIASVTKSPVNDTSQSGGGR